MVFLRQTRVQIRRVDDTPTPGVTPVGHSPINIYTSKFIILPWKFKIKVMTEVNPIGRIWGIKFHDMFAFRFVTIKLFLAEI